MNKSVFGPIVVIVICVLLTQSIALFAGEASKNFELNYIALFTVGIQWIFFIHASGILFGNERTEKYYDLMGSLTFLSTVFIVYISSERISLRGLILGLLVIIWTARLGAFLFIRISNNNGIDSRFTEIKRNNYRFLMTWTLQGVWVFITLLPLLIITTQKQINQQLSLFDCIGCLFWAFGFVFETVADYQKFKFRSEPENKEKFIKSGLWKYSRHPNYFGEILLWTSFAIIAFNGSKSYYVFISPIFVALLLIFISGIPLLENKSDEKFGSNEEYQLYKKLTPVLIPIIGRKGNAMF